MTIVCIESERAIIGAALAGSKETQEWISSEVEAKDFYDGYHQRAYRAIQAILDDGLEVNPVSVRERSRIGQPVLDSCVEEAKGIHGAALKTLISDVRSAATSRSLSAAFSEAVSECGSGKKPEQVLESLEGKIYGHLGGGIGKAAADAADVSAQVVRGVLDKVDNPGHVEVSSGLTLLDKAIIGLRPKLYVVGARPSMGKSALAQTIGQNVLKQESMGVITFSAEMSAEEILERYVASDSDVNVRKIMSGRDFAEGELARVVDAANHLPRDRWRIIDRVMPIGSVRRAARIEAAKMQRKGIKLALVVLDYIQLYADGENREQAVSAVARGCKLMSQELGCAVMALSQLNRGVEHREDKRPNLADLRESGSIEQDADCVMFVYRPNRYDQSVPEEVTELIVAKQRGGPIGSFPIRFNPKVTTFVDEAKPVPTVHFGEDCGRQTHGIEAEKAHSQPGIYAGPLKFGT